MTIDQNCLYSKNDEWVRIEGTTATIGISDYAQSQLSDIVFAEVSVEVDEELSAGDCIGTVESVKAASDVYSPVNGTVAEINELIADEPDAINKDAFGNAWFLKLTVEEGVDTSALMSPEAYKAYCEEREH